LHAQTYLTGLAHYRAGQYPAAVKRLEEALTGEPPWAMVALARPVLAMADQRCGQRDRARGSPAAPEKAIDRCAEIMTQGEVGTLPLPWFDWLEYLCLYRQARLLVTGAAPLADPRFRTVEQRAVAALRP